MVKKTSAAHLRWPATLSMRAYSQRSPRVAEVSFTLFFDNPAIGNHNALVLGWSDEQLQPIVDLLHPWLPADLTDAMRLAIAACARSIIAEHKLTGNGVHYPRGKDRYRKPQRYRTDDHRYTWHYVTNAMDLLSQAGLINQAPGIWFPGAEGFQSVAWPTDELMVIAGPLADPTEHRSLAAYVECIVLRDRNDRKEIDYAETATTTAMRQQVEAINDSLRRVDLYHGQAKLEVPVARRIFNGSFNRGGRLYCHGPSIQNMPAEDRRQLEVVIDGVAHPMAEIDFSNLHIEMAYREAGRRMPPGDQYASEGFNRSLVKLAVNTVFNARSNNSGILAITDELYHNRELRAANGIRDGGRRECRKLAEKVVEAIHQKHRCIKEYFGSDCGARFQRRDSDMAIEIMLKMIQRTGRCPLPIHDSFLVIETDAKPLADTMSEVARKHHLYPTLKILRRDRAVNLLFYMEVTASELHRLRPNTDRENNRFSWGQALVSGSRGRLFGSQHAEVRCCHDPPFSKLKLLSLTRASI
jgi:hypothetical protein